MSAHSPDRNAPAFRFIVSSLPGWADPGVAIAASHAGAVGVLNLESPVDPRTARSVVARVSRYARGSWGIQLDSRSAEFLQDLLEESREGWDILVVTPADGERTRELVRVARAGNREVLLVVTSVEEARLGVELGVDGLVAKGNEAGGWVGEETTFILLQRLRSEFSLPVWAQGGVGLHSAAACFVAGAAGVLLDTQVALTRESSLPREVRAAIEKMEGDETLCLGGGLGCRYRVYKRPGHPAVEELQRLESEWAEVSPLGAEIDRWRESVRARVGWDDPQDKLWPLGQDAAFTAALARRFRTVGGVLEGLRESVHTHLRQAQALRPLDRGAPLARSHGTEYPLVQGPMTRVSDTAAFAAAVAEAGGLPLLALALLRAPQVRTLLGETKQRLGERPWGVGILGFVPPDLRQEQFEVVRDFPPRFALIAGGRPDQATRLEQAGIATYLHVPAPSLLRIFLDSGARRFVFEGRECGGHVGPRTSFVLWDTMIEVLLEAMRDGVRAEELHVIFAGGILDARSAA
ncbi:MAG: nitronate monooxygenase, partial [Acidobacteria bacterium]|nr:nitronate monooxygenase [Acidobacteriota bacterium]